MLYWVAATFKPKTKKDEEALPDDIIVQPVVVVAKDEQSAAMKVTIKESEVLKKFDNDRVSIYVRPF